MISSLPLLIEVGNTATKIGRLDDEGTIRVERHADVAAAAALAAEYDQIVVDPFGVWPTSQRVRLVERREFLPFVAGSYDDVDAIGIDRILNLLGLPADGLVVSCGTAITIDALRSGRPLFGAILPGFRTALTAMHERIPTLPLVELDHPANLPARTTRDAVANGVLLGTVAAAVAIVRKLRDGSFDGGDVVTWLTGGDAGVMAGALSPDMGTFVVDDTLLFTGLARHAGIHPRPTPEAWRRDRSSGFGQ